MSDDSHQTDPRVARETKLEEIEALGFAAFPPAWKPADEAAELVESFDGEAPERVCRVAGRVVAYRAHGKTTFFHLADRTGRIQVYVRRDQVGEASYELVKRLDLGDFVGVAGSVFRTRTGEVTVRAEGVDLLAKALRPLPLGKVVEGEEGTRAYHRVEDREFRYRRRYADLAVRPEARDVFVRRAEVIRFLRRFLDERGFLEVETPALQPVYGGASARPFVTHHHALGVPLYLRIADELYLKRCIVGGLDRVYEIAKDFRNEGIDRFHSPEFTMLEFYQAYADYEDLMVMTEELLRGLVTHLDGGTTITYQGRTVSVAEPWPRVRFLDALAERGVPVTEASVDDLESEARNRGLDVDPEANEGQLLDALFSNLVEPELEGPLFVVDHPRSLSPLAKAHRDDPNLVERFEAYLFGSEWGNAFTELNDPRDQRRRFEAQAALAAAGDLEAPNVVDEDFLRALEYGMPPTAGMGIGVDRLVMFVTDQRALRDVVLFPALRPEEGRASAADDAEADS